MSEATQCLSSAWCHFEWCLGPSMLSWWLTEAVRAGPLPWLHADSQLRPVGLGPRVGAEDAVAHVRETFPSMIPPVPLGLPRHSGCSHARLV